MTLLHELRHVHQLQQDSDFEASYAHQNLTAPDRRVRRQPHEIAARYYGRLADPTGEKDTGPAGAHLGKAAWGVRPLPQEPGRSSPTGGE